MEIDSHYDCARCANRRSPLCELCTQVTSPSGKVSKPKYFVEFTGVIRRYIEEDTSSTAEAVPLPPPGKAKRRRPLPTERGEECAKLLEVLIEDGEPLPVSLVMEYNEHVEKKRES